MVELGLCRRTLRELSRPRGWLGLSVNDATLLATWLSRMTRPPDELHTDVCVGPVPELPAGMTEARYQRVLDRKFTWRVDAVLSWPGSLVLVELKPEATHSALGQCLFYRYWWERTVGCDALTETVLVTDVAVDALKPVLKEYRVKLVELGPVLRFSGAYPEAAARREGAAVQVQVDV